MWQFGMQSHALDAVVMLRKVPQIQQLILSKKNDIGSSFDASQRTKGGIVLIANMSFYNTCMNNSIM